MRGRAKHFVMNTRIRSNIRKTTITKFPGVLSEITFCAIYLSNIIGNV